MYFPYFGLMCIFWFFFSKYLLFWALSNLLSTNLRKIYTVSQRIVEIFKQISTISTSVLWIALNV